MTPWYRLGYLTPHRVIDTLPYQFYLFAPPGMMIVVGGTDLEAYERHAAEVALRSSQPLLDAMVSRRVDRIAIAGVPLAAALGRERMKRNLGELSERAGIEVDTDLEAIVRGIQHLGVERVAMATRWKPEVTAAVGVYLADANVEVVGEEAHGQTIAENAALTDADGMRMAIELGRSVLRSCPTAQGLVLPGLRWIASDAIPVLESEFGCPVFANVAASSWAALHASQWRGTIDGGGRLLASLAAKPT